MKRKLILLAAALCCLLCLASLCVYAIPLGTQSVDWSIMTEFGADAKTAGWTVYVVRAGEKVILEENNGRYAGCEPGETFYYTRIWDAEIAKPVLRIHALMPAVAVWLDDDLVYTDAPLAGDTVGRLALPMLTADRASDIEITLRGELYGRALTIAQASPLKSETGYSYVYPCDVEAVSAYGYERSLIARANLTGLMELTLCGVAALLCYLACKRGEGALVLLALLAFLRLLGVIAGADFFYQYTTLWGLDLETFANRLSFSVTLGYLALQCDRQKFLMAAMAALHAAFTAAALAVQIAGLTNDTFLFLNALPDWLTLAFLAGAAGLAVMQARRRTPFFALFGKLSLAFFAAGLVAGVVYLSTHGDMWNRLLTGRADPAIFLRGAAVWVVQGAGIGAAVIRAVKQLRAAREEKVFAAVRAQAVERSYENLLQYQRDVMTLRHEIKRHDLALKGFLDEGDTARAKEYLAALLEEQEHIPQIIHTDNALINIILGSRVATAESLGLSVEIRRMSVPKTLPLSDRETVSLVLNIVDNAIEAARKARPGLLRLDMHQKSGLFVFTCENTLPEGRAPAKSAGLTTHGYGLRIIERILEPFGSLLTAGAEDGLYTITVALPLGALGPEKAAAGESVNG